MFKEEVNGRKCFLKDGDAVIKGLVTTLVEGSAPKKADALENVISVMFGETEELENTDLTFHDDYTGIPDIVAAIPDAAVATPNTESDARAGDTEVYNTTKGMVNKISLENVFIQGTAKMVEMKIPKVRAQKQSRIQRSLAFFLEINSSVTETEDKLEEELSRITNVQLFNPWYRTVFRLIHYR